MEVRKMDKKKLSLLGKVLKVVLTIVMILGGLVLLCLPLITKVIDIHFDMFIIMVYPCGIGFLYIVYLFTQMFKSLEKSKPFVIDNSIRLKKSMYISYVIGFLILISILVTNIYNYYSLQLKVALLLISILFFDLNLENIGRNGMHILWKNK